MRTLRSTLCGGLMAALLLTAPVEAAPAGQAVQVDVTPASVTLYPLGTARVQMALTNSTGSEQVFALEILLVRADGSIATAYLSDAIALAPGTTVPAVYAIRHADGAVGAVVTARSWPYLSN